ncbi:glycine cleavage system protein GcvH [Halomarina oriensis]|uniref:Probable glycine cleavage system H protein n=1 Tax=Halomarina oriensis TaxID=671145 RepID=A0A6B0GQB7_9EURY|nr:glycine cleavage system protein GcvH [Halomarina oriensis]MWG35789.1 glycine cleavage system protein GcvH [Halomarina oriensis]
MSFETPDDLRYLETHEWARVESAEESATTARIGISDFAQDELGDVVFVELPEPGESLDQDAQFGVIESIKAVSDLYAPLSGTVSAVNETLFDEPELVNDDPYGDGWMLELEDVDESELDALLAADAYAEQID